MQYYNSIYIIIFFSNFQIPGTDMSLLMTFDILAATLSHDIDILIFIMTRKIHNEVIFKITLL